MVPAHSVHVLRIACFFLLSWALLTGCPGPSQTDASLSALSVSSGTLDPDFDPETLAYSVDAPYATASVTITATAAADTATITVDGLAVTSGSASDAIELEVGDTVVEVVVTAQDETTQRTYAITFTRLPEHYTLSLTVGDGGSITVGGTAYAHATTAHAIELEPGSTATIAVDSDTGYAFAEWSGDDAAAVSGGGPTYTLLMSADRSIGAVFGYDDIIYVHPSGDDTNGTGHVDAPFKSVTKAVTGASAGQAVHIAAGTYTSHVTLAAAVSLLGGYSATDWSVRDAATHTTTISDERTSGGTDVVPIGAIAADGSGVSSICRIDGLTIRGGSGDHTCGVLCTGGASPVISNNDINGGSGTAGAYGIFCSESSAPDITGNTINGGGGSGTDNAYGIYCTASSPDISGNDVDGGVANATSAAVSLDVGASSDVIGNALRGGAGSIASYALCLYSGSTASVVNNTMVGGNGSSYSFGMYVQDCSGVEVLYNTILGGASAGIAVGIGTAGTCAITATSCIVVCTEGATNYGAIDDPPYITASYCCFYVTGAGAGDRDFSGIDGYVGDNPVLGGEDGMHLTTTTPSGVSEGALTLSAVATDKDGTDRTEPCSMGAYELDTE